MLDREITLCQFALKYCHRLVDDVADASFTTQPMAGVPHPAWVVGHLAIAADAVLGCLGEKPVCPQEWWRNFGPGSVVQPDRAAYPSKAELVDAVDRGFGGVVEAAGRAAPELLAKPQNLKFYREECPTVGDLVAHLMTTHAFLHLGQLSVWRRMMGLPSALGI